MTLTPSEALQHLRLAVELSGSDVPEVVLPDTRHVVVAGTRLHCLDWGTRGRAPVLFLHGGALTARTWDVVCLGLRADYHCLALDQRGHGDSEWSPIMDYAPEAHCRDIDGVLDAYGIERVVLVGQSMGGLNGFVYATRHRQRVAALVLIDVGPEIRVDGAGRIREFVRDTAEIESIDAFVDQALAFNPLRDRRLLAASVRNNLRQLPNGRWTRKNDTRFAGQISTDELIQRIASYWQDVGQVACPTLVVRGAFSDVLTEEAAARLANRLPDGRLVTVENAGHTVQGDNPAGLITVLRPFLADASRR
jgi:pimeloyl-ACP methyl ester carboxylesterase